MSNAITIGKSEASKSVKLDIPRLIVSRMLVTADSGGGKSWLLRKVLEQVSQTTQTIVIDPEGEFSTLREKRDMVLAGPDGEVPAEPRSAGLLCRRLMELNLSAVIDLSELDIKRRREFVATFCMTMVDLPKALWGRCFVAIDEIHEFAPEDEAAESETAVAMLSSKGRKRGFCLIGATQRLSKLSKNVAAGLKNQFCGTFSLDADIKRAAGSLGFGKDRWTEIRDLSSEKGKEGEFFAFGPAFNHRGVVKMRTGQVETTHPEPGVGRAHKPPAPSEKIKGILAELVDLPQKAEAEIRDLVAAKAKIADLERAVKKHEKSSGDTPASRDLQQQVKDSAAVIVALRKGLADAMKVIAEISSKGFEGSGVDPEQIKRAVEAATDQIVKLVERKMIDKQAEFDRLKKEAAKVLASLQKLLGQDVTVKVDIHRNKPFTMTPSIKPAPRPRSNGDGGGNLPEGERKVLTVAAQYPDGAERDQISILTGYKRSTRDAYISRLRDRGFVNDENGQVIATGEGVASLGDSFEPLPTGEDLRAYWIGRLPEGERKIFEVLIENHPTPVERAAMDEAMGYKRSTRDAYITRLMARKLVRSAGRSGVVASDKLFD